MLESILLDSIIGEASPVELAWTALGLIGIYFGLLNAVEAWINRGALGRQTNGRRVLANRAIRRESIKGVIFSLAIALGVLASLAPSAPVRSETALIGSLILIVILTLLVVDSILDRRDDKYLVRWGVQGRDEKGRFTRIPETQNQREDRQFGEVRRDLEQKHLDDK